VRGHIYTIGSNDCGRLGISNRSLKMSSSPCLVEDVSNLTCTKVQCGFGHTLALFDSGIVYSWGQGDFGALGTGSADNAYSPKLVNFPNRR
jgi:alpha-tubulin suppressor-like RCC1 family protein